MARAFHLLPLTIVAFLTLAACAGSPESSPRPRACSAEPAAEPATETRFERWLRGFRKRALASGITETTWNRAMSGVTCNPKVIERDRYQSEFTRPIWEYLDSAVSPARVANGQRMLLEYRPQLDAIERKYGVDKEVIVAIWGLESRYGAHRGTTEVLPALATLAYDGRRGAFFAGQLIAALRIVQSGDVDARHMTGSWAGAMGHTQFIPTSYLTYAVDFTGDGKRDIWSNDPTDALASTAAYLARSGWTRGQPWGVEVTLPSRFNYALTGKDTKKSPADWAALGVRSATGETIPDYGTASILVPTGARGPAFMIFGNFGVIAHYNAADSYVIGVGHLSDRIKGKGSFVKDWPRTGKPLSKKQNVELQERLTAAGFDTDGTDGRIGPDTTRAIVAYQKSRGLVPDGYATPELLQTLR